MSNMYAFKEETITALGDAVRAKVAGETRDVPVTSITWTNISMPILPVDQLTVSGANYTCTSEPISLPEFPDNVGYFMVACEGLNTSNGSYITATFTGEYSNEYVGMAPASESPYRVNAMSYNRLLTVHLTFGAPQEDYNNGVVPGAALITITAYDASGTQVEWTTPEKNTMTVAQMTEAIANAPALPNETNFTITGNCSYRFANNGWNWVIDKYGDKITTKEIELVNNMFDGCNLLTKIPFDINCLGSYSGTGVNLFNNCSSLVSIGAINNLNVTTLGSAFNTCLMLRELPVFNNTNWSSFNTATYGTNTYIFTRCSSLRRIPESLLKNLWNRTTSQYSSPLNSMFAQCYALDEIRGLRGPDATITANHFSATFNNCEHLKSLVFDTQPDGTPYVVNWKNQTIDLGNYPIGYVQDDYDIFSYNSGLTAEDRITSESEILVKDDTLPRYHIIEGDDWWTTDVKFSRYNRESAIETFNSLPDTSAYLASAGGTNSIKLKTNQANGWCRPIYSGSTKTGSESLSLSALTEEEIAIATAKGWTVSFVD